MLHFLRRLELLLRGCGVKTGFRLGAGSRGTLSLSMAAGSFLQGGGIVHCLGVSSAIWQGWRKGGRRALPPRALPPPRTPRPFPGWDISPAGKRRAEEATTQPAAVQSLGLLSPSISCLSRFRELLL